MKSIKKNLYIPTNFEVERISDNHIKIVAYPFEEGCAITIAHPMRRLLLASSVGYAPTAIRIEGVNHEFDSMRGVVEDVTPFIINIKNLSFRVREAYAQDDKLEFTYEFEGPLELKGKDLNNEFIEVISEDKHVASINSNAKLSFSLVIQKGIDFVPSESIRPFISEDFIALDAYFTPVRKAIYKIDSVLHEGNPNFEKMIFEIETNGQADPLEVFKRAVASMHNQMSIFGADLGDVVGENPGTSEDIPSKLLASVDTLGLEHRPSNCLQKIGIKYIGELVLMSESDVKSIKNLGKKSYDEIASKLESLGFPIGIELPNELVLNLNKRLAKLKQ